MGRRSRFFSVYNQSGTNITNSIAASGQNGVPMSMTARAGRRQLGMEEALDIEWAHAIAPGAKIVLVEANSPGNASVYRGEDGGLAAGESRRSCTTSMSIA